MENETNKLQTISYKYTAASFMMSSPNLQGCPADLGAEIAFAGRSNAGKSSALNRLCEQPKLARTSKTPGRTQLINFFELAQDKRLVDLPGYGYAKVPIAVKEKWEKNLTEYLNQRKSLCGCVLLMDIRRPLQEFDCDFINWALAKEKPLHLVLTKADKMKRGPALNVIQNVKKQLNSEFQSPLLSIQSFSSLKGTGLNELRSILNKLLSSNSI